MRVSGASAVRSQPKLTTRQALASSSRVTRRGRSGRTSTPSSSKRATTFGWIAGSGSVPANVLRTARPRSSARRWNSVAAIRLFAAPWRQTKTTVRSLMRDLLFHEDPCRVEEREGRSEEHTSELQSRLHLVCRLLLEKKKIRTLEIPPVLHRVHDCYMNADSST